jgi:hypothetical protein
MYLVRLWLFTDRVGEFYPEDGTYDTSVVDIDTGNCSDPQQFDRFEMLLDYANSRGEELQQVATAEEAYAICSRNRFTNSVAPCGGGYVNTSGTMSASYSRPVSGCNMPYSGGGSRSTPPAPQCPPVPPIVDPTISSQPVVQTATDNARRIIALARQNRIVPTIVY